MTSARRATRSKAHHFIPVPHLARFSLDEEPVRARDRRLYVFDKRSGVIRSSKTGKVAFENDLYTVRLPTIPYGTPDFDLMLQALLDPANKDAGLETDKIEIEERGLAAISGIANWPIGIREISEDDRAPVLSYIGLLLAQHPTMMTARIERVRERFWAKISPLYGRLRSLDALVRPFDQGAAAFATVFDGFATALELNFLAWKVVDWANGPRLILGDTAVVAWYPGSTLGVGDPWSSDAKFILPLSPHRALILGGHAPGICLVEDRSGPDALAEVTTFNVMSWARARAEVYAASESDLVATRAELGPLDPRSDNSMQVAVRDEVLPDFALSAEGLEIIQPPTPDSDEVAKRYAARFVQNGSA